VTALDALAERVPILKSTLTALPSVVGDFLQGVLPSAGLLALNALLPKLLMW
jgi:hypothetical protein